MKKICPGMWRGLLPIALPMSCDLIHFIIGILAGAFQSLFVMVIFILYQITEPLFTGVPDKPIKDVGIFVFGFYLCYYVGLLLA